MKLALALTTILAACSSKGKASDQPDAALTPDAFAEQAHDPAPQVVSGGGNVLATPHVVPIFFTGDSDEPTIEQFLTQLQSSAY